MYPCRNGDIQTLLGGCPSWWHQWLMGDGSM